MGIQVDGAEAGRVRILTALDGGWLSFVRGWEMVTLKELSSSYVGVGSVCSEVSCKLGITNSSL